MPQVDAPYVETDRRMLGDSHLDPAENVHKQREDLLKKASIYRIDGQTELENKDREYGPRIGFEQLLSRLTRLAPQLSAREGSEGSLALYFPRTGVELDEALREGGANDIFFIFNKYVGGIMKTEIPEYSYVDLDTSLLPTREHTKSWRSVLIGLIKAGVISYNQAINEFGDPTTDKRSGRWFHELEEWRMVPNRACTRRQLMEISPK